MQVDELIKGKVYTDTSDPDLFWVFIYSCLKDNNVLSTKYYAYIPQTLEVWDYFICGGHWPLAYPIREATESEIKMLEEACKWMN